MNGKGEPMVATSTDPFSLGVELEMPTANASTGATHPVHGFFASLAQILADQGLTTRPLRDNGREYGLRSSRGLHSIDNGFNNLESSLGPVAAGGNSLDNLAAMIRREIKDVSTALSREGAMLVNFSEHPAVAVDEDFYFAHRAPKAIYDYQILHRGWNHMSGFDAKAQNSPSTGMEFSQAVSGLNCLLALAPAFIALYANSPFEAGILTPNKENRLTIWPRQLDCSRMPGDHKLHRAPNQPFRNLADYLTWMFGLDTQMWFAEQSGQGKSISQAFLAPGDPPLLDFLRGGPRRVVPYGPGNAKIVTPSIRHLEDHQFAQYADCRLRYAFATPAPDLERFLALLEEQPDELETFFQDHAAYCYLEGRAAGATFADQELLDLAGEQVGASAAVSPSALQYGLLRDLDRTKRLVAGHAWSEWIGLREQAVRNALDGEFGGIKLRHICAAVLEIAGNALAADQNWMLAYPLWVLRTEKTGADRALARFARTSGPPTQRLRDLIQARRVIPV
ncbi:glutamate-cysteine ligase family protein [Desulfonatronum thiodismutans]|uniref:glutamate-cysteine ligase family protein n=1 Tax=Desulfonatronum thiodismutans TaxID=159290 RepID=UPI00068D1D7D|nr:glutamate-cysteine ligase family protein [Desulfonatronum thiodismutans]